MDGIGKAIGNDFYVHVSLLDQLSGSRQEQVACAETLAKVTRDQHYNVVRFSRTEHRVSLLNYPGFFEDAFPSLRESWSVDVSTNSLRHTTYAKSDDPPILHRKELLVGEAHERFQEFAKLTIAAESIGLFDNPGRIGRKKSWAALVKEKGYRINQHSLDPIGNDDGEAIIGRRAAPAHALGWQADRHLTALTRYAASAPVQSLARYGFLEGQHTFFDYGCGRGDDLRHLAERGIAARGWDPYHAPDNEIVSAEVVNLGFVINVIESPTERAQALERAWALTTRVLAVSVMLTNQNEQNASRFADGVMTRRRTFQKYFSQEEIRSYLLDVLGELPIPVAPGVFYVFRDKDAEQRFLSNRYKRTRAGSVTGTLIRPRSQTQRRAEKEAETYARYEAELNELWSRWLELGRAPEPGELQGEGRLVEGFCSLSRARSFILARSDRLTLEQAEVSRASDLKVYFALNQFERRASYHSLEKGLQRDVKSLFGSYAVAQHLAKKLLYQIADITAIAEACRLAAEDGLGRLEEGESLQLHSSLVEKLPELLRVYIGCASFLYGDFTNADLVKIHIRSGKISLMKFDDFSGPPLPLLTERVKISLREQRVNYFKYGEEFESPFLFGKARYIDRSAENYGEQLQFDHMLNSLGLFDLSGYGPSPKAFREALAANRWEIDGFQLARFQEIPELDAPCGRYFTFRNLIECGETQARTGLPNKPTQANTYNALFDLTTAVLDPLIDYFGMIRLTYAFCSSTLAKEIHGRIDPSLDQHASYELSRTRNPICKRLGAAVDFIIDDENMLEVAQWIVCNTCFDRLYFYGGAKPVHVSCSSENSGCIVLMKVGRTGRLVPRVLTRQEFLDHRE